MQKMRDSENKKAAQGGSNDTTGNYDEANANGMPQFNTIQRAPHDRENPYALISRSLIRNESISPECRFLLTYLLSNKEGWIIYIPHLVNRFKEYWGRDKTYKIFNEAIRSGYIKKEHVRSGGKFMGSIYYLFESPDLKESLPNPEKPDTVKPDPANTDPKDILSSTNVDKKKQCKERSAQAEVLTQFFLESVKNRMPNFRMKAKMDVWITDMDYLIRIDERTEKEIRNVIAWLPKHTWYKTHILSPENHGTVL